MHDHNHHKESKNLGIAFLLNFGFTLVEFIGGLLTNSLAIISDAIHDLGDSIALAIAWYLQRISGKKSNKTFTYGYRRFSLLGALINSLILLGGSIFIISSSIERFMAPEEANAKGMLLLAVLGIAVNTIAYLRLRGGRSENEKVVSLHLLEDVLGWIAVLIGSVVMYFTHWYIIDPILSLGISVYIIFNVISRLKASLKVILQATPEDLDLEELKQEILKLPAVCGVHDLHVWSLDGDRSILTAHIVLKEGTTDQHTVKLSIKQKMRDHHIIDCTLELEEEHEVCEPHEH